MIDYIIVQHEKWLLILGVFAVVTVIEMVFHPRADEAEVLDRLLNVGAGSVLLIVGGYMGYLVAVSLDRLNIFRESTINEFAYAALFLLLFDFIYYFYHRLQHSWPWLWEIHKLHHTDSDVNITTSYRTHILERPIQALFISVPVVLFLGFHLTGFLYVTYIGMFFLYFGHTRLDINLGPLTPVIVGPCFHRVHHSIRPEHVNRNFAQYFSFLDLLFGTFAKPPSINEIDTGVVECANYRDQWLPMIWPISLLTSSGRRGDS